MDIHIQPYKTDVYKRSVINMGTKVIQQTSWLHKRNR